MGNLIAQGTIRHVLNETNGPKCMRKGVYERSTKNRCHEKHMEKGGAMLQAHYKDP